MDGKRQRALVGPRDRIAPLRFLGRPPAGPSLCHWNSRCIRGKPLRSRGGPRPGTPVADRAAANVMSSLFSAVAYVALLFASMAFILFARKL